ncbi:hypothetical protein PDESU_02614 [Pontiella desulfatans]|uniref:Uncharacterized protein n=1 Tax=Pontiella desulfatans TaxID=2750659 RepID=A0A6C2U2F9_PONDE|nr:hypothetical protein [Pontiella desulfatans]VGO14057.1 hypothetical protein PDESU_02614 [Pontiella desulfatans]
MNRIVSCFIIALGLYGCTDEVPSPRVGEKAPMLATVEEAPDVGAKESMPEDPSNISSL